MAGPLPSQPMVLAPKDLRNLPADLKGLSELVDQRTNHSATFRKPDGSFTSLISNESMHYQDYLGRWQVIDAAFTSNTDGYLVERNSLRSKVGQNKATIAAVVGNVMLNWQATGIGIQAGSIYTTIASALASPTRTPQERDEDRTLYYAGTWDNAQVADQVTSGPDRIEQSLVLLSAPAIVYQTATGEPAYVVERATLKMLPNTFLWADGQLQTGEFRTTGSFEVRDANGKVAFHFDPVAAYEQADPSAAVAGEYVVKPAPLGQWTPGPDSGSSPQVYTVDIRTPLAWWRQTGRRFPVVIDPTMRVLQTTGNGTAGMAWVGNGPIPVPGFDCNPMVCDTTDNKLKYGNMYLGSGFLMPQYRGYIQFNAMPYLLTNHPISVSTAYLDVQPSGVMMPGYKYDDDPGYANSQIQHDAQLYGLSQCPAGCNGFSLLNTAATWNWFNTPTTGPYYFGVHPVAAPAPQGPNQGALPATTTWDVTTFVRAWEQQRPTDGPLFLLQFSGPICTTFGDEKDPTHVVFDEDHNNQIPQCTRAILHPTDVRLRINYDALTLNPYDNLLNKPGVPSYLDGVFDNGVKGPPTHQYVLSPLADGAHWRGVAVRPNDAIAPALSGQSGLLLRYYPNPNSENGTVELGRDFGNANVADDTEFILIDDHNTTFPSIANSSLKVDVPASKTGNNFPTDGGRNYRINYSEATTWSVPYGSPQSFTVFYPSDRLLNLREFDLARGDNVLISVTIPVTLQAQLALVNPTSHSGGAIANAVRSTTNHQGVVDSSGFGPHNVPGAVAYNYVDTFTPDDGTYLLAFINKGRPTPDPIRPTSAKSFNIGVTIMRCPFGSIATARYGCQPILAPVQGTTPVKNNVLGLDIYSEGGFVTTANGWCSTGESAGTPMIGPSFGNRWVSVAQGSVCYDGTTLSTTVETGVLLVTQTVALMDGRVHGVGPFGFSYGTTAFYPLPNGQPTGVVTRTAASQALNLLEPISGTRRNLDPFTANWSNVTTHVYDHINMNDVKMYGDDVITVPVAINSSAAPTVTSWLVPWQVYPDEAADPYLLYSFDYVATQTPLFPRPIDLSSMSLRILGPVADATTILDYNKQANGPEGVQFRGDKGKITQPEKLGGATKNVQVVVLPPGQSRYSLPTDPVISNCGAGESCLDIYDQSYQFNVQITPWVLPDVHVTGNAGTVILARSGQVDVFSKDHPNSAADVNESFSFDTFSVKVSIREAACIPGGPVVSIVHGEGFIALPMLGGDGSDGQQGPPSVSVDFTLCDAKLYEASLTLNIHPSDIPVGSTGVGVYLIGGKVVVNPDYTVVTITLGFETLDKETLTSGMGNVVIDTRGMFQLSASATIISVINANLLLQVAWNPLDILLDASANCCGGIITGELKLEGWIGQGWQHKYKWLPDNNKFHFAGKIQAMLKIPKGDVSDFFDLPPFNIELGIKVAFGEFCTNDKCTDTSAGMDIVLDLFGFNIGLYIDKHGPSFILGSDNHVLINEYQGGMMNMFQPSLTPARIPAPADPAHWLLPQGIQMNVPVTLSFPITILGGLQVLLINPFKTPVDGWKPVTSNTLCNSPTASTVECPFTMTQSAGRAMFLTHWENGSLGVSLIRPDNTVITPGNAAAYGVTVTQVISPQFKQVAFAVHPTGGAGTLATGPWMLKLDNVGLGLSPGITKNHWSMLFFADPPPPSLTWQTPVVSGTLPNGSNKVNLQWSATRAGQPLTPSTRLELFFTPVISKPTDPGDFAGTIIVAQYTATLGTYAWDVSGLRSGEYAVGARIDDHLNSNGAIVFWAPGTVLINDTTPPPPPVLIGTQQQLDALVVRWGKLTTPDLAGYLVDYTIYDWDETTVLTRTRRVLAHSFAISPTFELPYERVRLGGLLSKLYNGKAPTTNVCLRSYDASGNISPSNCYTITLTLGSRPPLGPPGRVVVQMTDVGGIVPIPGARVLWSNIASDFLGGYLLSYWPVGCILPNVQRVAAQGPSPIDVGRVTSYTLTGLTIGQRYAFAVNGYELDGSVGPGVVTYRTFVEPGDSNNDGIPDQWEALYGVTDPNADPDHDGLTNLQEYQFGTDPNNAYSGGGKYSDGEIYAAGLEACSPVSPGPHASPKLTLVGNGKLIFHVATNNTNAQSQTIKLLNFGAGLLNWTAAPSDPWIILDHASGQGDGSVRVGVNPNGLMPGHYEGQVTFNNTFAGLTALQAVADTASSVLAPGAVVTETATVDVVLDVLPKQQFDLYLPRISR
jgi:hypothetical protein